MRINADGLFGNFKAIYFKNTYFTNIVSLITIIFFIYEYFINNEEVSWLTKLFNIF